MRVFSYAIYTPLLLFISLSQYSCSLSFLASSLLLHPFPVQSSHDPQFILLYPSYPGATFHFLQNLSSSIIVTPHLYICLLYTSDAADEEDSVDLGGRRIIKK